MKQLLLTYLRPYRKRISLVVMLVLVQSIGNLYLPTLNADIINVGIAKGDTGYILRTGGIMLGVALLITALLGHLGVPRLEDGHGHGTRRKGLAL